MHPLDNNISPPKTWRPRRAGLTWQSSPVPGAPPQEGCCPSHLVQMGQDSCDQRLQCPGFQGAGRTSQQTRCGVLKQTGTLTYTKAIFPPQSSCLRCSSPCLGQLVSHMPMMMSGTRDRSAYSRLSREMSSRPISLPLSQLLRWLSV